MTNRISAIMVALAFSGGMAFLASGVACSDSKSNSDASATGGAGGGNVGGTGGAGGGVATQTTVPLTGAAEVPPSTSTATGTATVTWDATTMTVSISGSFDGLSANVTAAHLHGPAVATANGPVLFALDIPAPLAASGTFSGSAALSAANWAAFLAGMTYVNVHTTLNPGGEIRGQVTP